VGLGAYWYWQLYLRKDLQESRAASGARGNSHDGKAGVVSDKPVQSTAPSTTGSDDRAYEVHTVWFWVVLLVRMIFVSTNRAYAQFRGDDSVVLYAIHIVFSDGAPILNCVTWLTSPFFKRVFWAPHCSCCKLSVPKLASDIEVESPTLKHISYLFAQVISLERWEI